MNSRFLPLLHNELAKARRRRLPYFGIGISGLLCWLIYWVADRLSSASSANAWGYVGFTMQLVFNDIGLIFILVFSAMLMAEETGTGTIRAALAAPVDRWELYLAKAVTGLLYMMLLSTAVLLFAGALAKIHYDFGPVGDRFGVVYSRGTAARVFLVATLLSWVPLAALVMFGLLISTFIRNSGAAVSVGISTIYLIDFTKHLVGLDPYIFTKHIGYPWIVLQQAAQGVDFQWQPEVWNLLGLCGAHATLCFVLGLIIFLRQDLNE